MYNTPEVSAKNELFVEQCGLGKGSHFATK
jgi:hypothetical protein